MCNFALKYAPEHLALGDTAAYASATDGDTPKICLPVRMLGIDAPELHYQGADETHPGKYDASLANFLATAGKFLDNGLQTYLAPRLADHASSRQITAGRASHKHFLELVRIRLDRGVDAHGKPRTPRKLFIMVAEQVFDQHGRLLAYVNANYTKEERKKILPYQRPTFNLQMIQDGHAASLLIYPNVPKPNDLQLVQAAVRMARQNALGFWAQGDKGLLPYEFRWLVDTLAGTRHGPDRYCGDLTTGELFPPQQYYLVLPENRLFFYPQDLAYAVNMGFMQKGQIESSLNETKKCATKRSGNAPFAIVDHSSQ